MKALTRYSAFLAVFGFLMLFFPHIGAVSYGQNSPALESAADVDVVWPEFIDNNFEIYYNFESNGVWQAKTRLTRNNLADITPSVTAGQTGDTFVVWSVVDGMESRLKYCRYQNREWSKPETIPSNLKSNMAPSVLIDDSDNVWVVWSGFDGQDDDIFFSVLKNGRWEAPRRVNPDNSLPDVLPLIGIDDNGNPEVKWKSFDGDIYQNYQAIWDGIGWTSGPEAQGKIINPQETNEFQAVARRVERHVKDVMSGDIQNRRIPRRAGFHIRKHGRFQSIPFNITKSDS